jgi:glycosyltransferase involved in cell wall biosynthesis
MAAIKILYVIDSYENPNAGTEGQLFQLIKHLDRELFEPKLLVLKYSSWLAENDFPCEIDVLDSSSLKSPKTWYRLFNIGRKYAQQHYKLAHIYFNDSSVICPPVFKLVGIKTLISRRDMGYWYNRLYRLLLPFTGKFTSGVVVNSAAVGGITQQVEKISDDKVSIIYNGYEVPKQALVDIDKIEKFKGDNVLLGLVANIRSIKRINDAITALAQISHTNVKLVIIGSGNPEALEKLASGLGLKDRVLFFGASTDVRSCLRYFDIGLLCSESEGFSNAIVEYQFSGLPVICSNVGGNPEAIEHGKTGFLYPAKDVDKLKHYLDLLVHNKELKARFSAATMLHAQNSYSVEKMISSHEQLYKKVIN